MAARHHMTIAEMYEDVQDLAGAIGQYEKGAEYYKGEESHRYTVHTTNLTSHFIPDLLDV